VRESESSRVRRDRSGTRVFGDTNASPSERAGIVARSSSIVRRANRTPRVEHTRHSSARGGDFEEKKNRLKNRLKEKFEI
jgi:hypothetical protein